MDFWSLKAHLQWCTSSSKTTVPNPARTVLLNRDQAFKRKSLWGLFSFRLHSVQILSWRVFFFFSPKLTKEIEICILYEPGLLPLFASDTSGLISTQNTFPFQDCEKKRKSMFCLSLLCVVLCVCCEDSRYFCSELRLSPHMEKTWQ